MKQGASALLTDSAKTAFAETGDAQETTATRSRFSLPWEYIAVALVILLISSIRFRLRDFPLERDEGEYAYAGQLILQGIPPYQLAYNMKLPGTYAAYAALMAVFGPTPAGIHLGLIIVNSASILLVFLIVRRLFDPVAAVTAGAVFGLFTIRPMLLGIAAHATHFVTVFALLGIWILFRAFDSNRLVIYFSSGFCFGLAFLMKQPGIFFGIFGGLYLSMREWPRFGVRTALARKLISFSAGAILPYAATCLMLWRAGVFPKFWFWTVSYARAYGAELSIQDGLRQIANRMELQKENIWAILLLIVFGMASFLWERKSREHVLFALGWLAFSFLAVSVGLYFRGHYFIMLYPAIATLAGIGLSALTRSLTKLRGAPTAVTAAAAPILLVSVMANSLYADRKTYFSDGPREACRDIYGTNPFPEAVAVGNYVRDHSGPDARVAVIGSEPEIYFYAHRLSATGYIYTYALVEEQPYGSVMQNEMIREVESVRPEIIVYVLTHESWLTKPRADRHIFNWADEYLRQNYLLEGIADGGPHDVYVWGGAASQYRPRRPEFIAVYRRRS